MCNILFLEVTYLLNFLHLGFFFLHPSHLYSVSHSFNILFITLMLKLIPSKIAWIGMNMKFNQLSAENLKVFKEAWYINTRITGWSTHPSVTKTQIWMKWRKNLIKRRILFTYILLSTLYSSAISLYILQYDICRKQFYTLALEATLWL